MNPISLVHVRLFGGQRVEGKGMEKKRGCNTYLISLIQIYIEENLGDGREGLSTDSLTRRTVLNFSVFHSLH